MARKPKETAPKTPKPDPKPADDKADTAPNYDEYWSKR